MLRRVASLRALRHRGYRTVWAGAFVSNIGNWMQTVALGVYVTETTGRAGWTGTITALTFFPVLVLGPVSGALADRVNRRWYLFFATLAQALLAGAMAGLAFAGRLTLPWVGALTLLSGIFNALLNPAFSALLVDIVPGEDLLSAVSLNSAQFNLGRVIGPLLAALAISAGGVGAAFAANAASYLAVLLALGLLRGARPAPRTPEPIWAGIRRGLAAARGDVRISEALGVTFLIGALVAPFIGLIPVMAIKLLGGGASETSLLVSSQGLGAVCAALLAGTLAERLGGARLARAAAFAAPVAAAVYWLMPGVASASAALLLVGGAYLVCLSGLNTRIQTHAPPELRGRIASLYSMLLGGGYALGLSSLGWLGDHLGMRLVGAGAAVACLLVLLRGVVARPGLLVDGAPPPPR